MTRYIWFADGHCEPLDELYHYGVKGMKWGVRKRRETIGKAKYDTKNHRQLSLTDDDARRKDRKNSKSKRLRKQYMHAMSIDAVVSDWEAVDGPVQKLSEFKRIPPSSYDDNIKKTNPPYGKVTPGRMVNCTRCAIALDARAKGYDVTARRTSKGCPFEDLMACYKGAEGFIIEFEFEGGPLSNQDKYNAFQDSIVRKRGKNSRGIMSIEWEGLHSGHSLNYEVKDGRLEIFDSQKGVSREKLDDYFTWAAPVVKFIDTQNAEFTEELGKYVVG